MKLHGFNAIMITLTLASYAKSQSLDSLNQLKNHDFKVYYSAGHQQRAETIASRVEKAIVFNGDLLDFKPTITLIILSAKDWNVYTSFQVVYGMPHYNEKNQRLIVAAEDNEFWQSFLPPLDQLPNDLRNSIQRTYTNEAGALSMQPFFDLLAIHELGHAFHTQGALTMQRNWMGELFVNILLHTYIAEKEPEQLPALTIFPRMVVAGGVKGFKYTSLQEVHEHYSEIVKQYPRIYGWYQCRWHAAAAGIYDEGGKQVLRKLWDALKDQKEILSDEELVNFIGTKADKNISDMITHWDRDNIH